MSGKDDPRPAPASVPVPRVIPGLSVPSSTAPPKPSRKRSKNKQPASSPGPTFTGQVEGAIPEDRDGEIKHAAQVQLDKDDDDLTVEDKKTSAVEVVTKRLRAATKKLQRIEGYEKQEAPLNADQKRAVEGKPVLEAVIRELNELNIVLKAEEQEEEARAKRVEVVQEKKQVKAIEAAVKASKADAQSHLVLLFQFLHLHQLFSPSETSFAPPVLPPVVAAATGQEAAAVRMLFDQFADGPLLGGNNDATERLAKVAEGSGEEVLLGVTYARIQQLIHGLTAPPEDVPASPLSSPTETQHPISSSFDSPAKPTDSVVALVDGDEGSNLGLPTPEASAGYQGGVSFLQPSEVNQPSPFSGQTERTFAVAPGAEINGHDHASHPNPPVDSLPTQGTAEKVQHWATEIADEAAGPPPSGPVTPTADVSAGLAAIGAQTVLGESAATPVVTPAATPSTEAPPAARVDWAADDGEDDSLPHLPELAPPVPVLASGAASAPVAAEALQAQQQQKQRQHGRGAPSPNGSNGSGDGFQPARPSRRGSGVGGGPRGRGDGSRRGSFRGGRGRGGGGAGGANGERATGAGAEGESRPPRPEGQRQQSGEGGFRGRGRGDGGRGGRGRGGANGANGAGGERKVQTQPVQGPAA
ncbi:hypothetical protein JCM8097_007030 [Rhodosporidiobolus ruineniae]